MTTTAPDWQINVVGPDYADIQEGQARVVVYDYAQSNAEPVYAETVIATDVVEDEWYSPEELEDEDNLDLGPTMLATVRRVFASALDDIAKRAAAAPAGSGGQGRIGRGVPTGGQFASVDRAESAVSLA